MPSSGVWVRDLITRKALLPLSDPEISARDLLSCAIRTFHGRLAGFLVLSIPLEKTNKSPLFFLNQVVRSSLSSGAKVRVSDTGLEVLPNTAHTIFHIPLLTAPQSLDPLCKAINKQILSKEGPDICTALPTTYHALGMTYDEAFHRWAQSCFPPSYPHLDLTSLDLGRSSFLVTQETLPFGYSRHSSSHVAVNWSIPRRKTR